MEHTDMLKILYCKSRDFRFQDEKLPTKGDIEEHWQELPEWVVENLAEDGLAWYFRTNIERTLVRWLEEIYRRMNNYNTNPLAVEYHHKNRDEEDLTSKYAPNIIKADSSIGQEWLKENGIGHTSMSVGDIIVVNHPSISKMGNGYYYCMSIGFDKIHSI